MEDSSEKPKLEKEQPNSVEISMGTLFKIRVDGKVTRKVYVINDIGNGDYFDAMILKRNKKGERYILGGSTFRSEDFGERAGQMSPEEVIEAAKLGAEKMGYVLSQRELDILLESAKKKPRTISPSSSPDQKI